ncbi:RNA chaperone ProQ [Alteromonas oceanisediminis]|uniref:RNA chaperone ProQ n=1 Tax=Alteromonas oceanisediminis TaxID=2836180 RepID=UPI001BD9FF5B|nr:RNA chaperone ProQ [Alteromonas oceanisediminis]MBT0587125.1 RNA chaperone ProQ [Alteromonas oceanisediminis]
METSQKFANSKEVIAFLAESYPQCFTLSGPAKPLKIGIFQELAAALEEEPRVSKTLLRASLRHYTNSWRYLESITAGAHRVGLDGSNDAVIEQEHAEHAQQQLEESKAKAAEKRKALKKDQHKKKSERHGGAAKPRGANAARNAGTKSAPSHSKKPVAQKLTADDIRVGTHVTVKLGKVPMPAVITDVAKDGIHVQVDSGMVVKVDESALRLANSKRS